MARKKLKLTIKTYEKSYSFRDSALYHVTSKNKLAKLLLIDLSELKTLCADSNYRCFVDESTGKPRDIEHPYFKLDKVHTRIASLLCRIKQPDYIHSGVKKKSHITNAKEHIGLNKVLTTDLKSFFQSTTRFMVFNYFHKKMNCVSDVAHLLSHLCTCKNHIPTGSRISMPLAFWANESMFNILDKVSRHEDIKMTVFVDDITFSGKRINSYFLHKIKNIIENHGHKTHPDKTKLFKQNDIKIITGVAVGEDGILVCNKHHKLIYQDMVQWLATKDVGYIENLNNRLLGRINSQSTIDPRFKDKARMLKISFNNLKHSELNENS